MPLVQPRRGSAPPPAVLAVVETGIFHVLYQEGGQEKKAWVLVCGPTAADGYMAEKPSELFQPEKQRKIPPWLYAGLRAKPPLSCWGTSDRTPTPLVDSDPVAEATPRRPAAAAAPPEAPTAVPAVPASAGRFRQRV